MMDSCTDITMELAEREKFGDIECSIYRNTGSNELFFTREQIGTALEYSEPRIAIMKIHSRHADRLNRFSTVVSLSKSGGTSLVSPNLTMVSIQNMVALRRQLCILAKA